MSRNQLVDAAVRRVLCEEAKASMKQWSIYTQMDVARLIVPEVVAEYHRLEEF